MWDYPNNVAAAILTGASDSLAFDKHRQEICYGTNVSNVVNVDSLNAIHSRVINLIHYLDVNYPSQNWSQYLSSSSTLNWPKIVVGGHSQGAGHACYFAKYGSVERVLMFSGPNDYSDHFSQAANWIRTPGITATNRHYAYLSLLDEVVDFRKQLGAIEGLGLFPASDTTHVDAISTPYNDSHCLYTTQAPGLALLHHNSPLKVSEINNSVWEYMLTSPILSNNKEIDNNPFFTMFPNPTKTQLNVNFGSDMIGKSYYIIDMMGQIIKSEKLRDSSVNIDLSNLVSGSYLFSIENQTHIFIKE